MFGGATPFMTNSSIPNGGVINPASKLISMNTPNQTGSKTRSFTMGMKIGMQIIMMDMVSMKQPMTKTISCIPSRMTMGAT